MTDRLAQSPGATLVLLSGGLDSAVLVAHEAQRAPVVPVYVSVGLAWEPLELAMVERLLAHPSVARCVEEARPYRPYFPLGAPDRD